MDACIKRVNRALAHQDRKIHTTRGDRWRSTLGDYYIRDVYGNVIIDTDINPVTFARSLGVLRPGETVAAA
jgi:hypothetical protein